MLTRSYIIVLTIIVVHYIWYYLTLPNTLGLVNENKKLTVTKVLTSYLIYMFLFIIIGTIASSYLPTKFEQITKALST